MPSRIFHRLCVVLLTSSLFALASASPLKKSILPVTPETRAFLNDIAAKSKKELAKKNDVIVGKKGWVFFSKELKHVSVGPFWGPASSKTTDVTNKKYADPLPAIVYFKHQLEKKGIELIVVPIPTKTVIYPDMISDTIHVQPGQIPPRTDIYDQQFFDVLRAQGVEVLDMAPQFLQNRFGPQGALFCQQDTHWSDNGCILAAKLIADEVKKRAWVASIPKRTYVIRTEGGHEFIGDLHLSTMPVEKLSLSYVYEQRTHGILFWKHHELRRIIDDPSTPVLLLGDSFTDVFSGATSHGFFASIGAGLPEQLTYQLGFPVDTLPVHGSPGYHALTRLMYRPDRLNSKRIVIWCFTARDFTDSWGWKQVTIFP